jgi:ssDNA-binding Zn-finger/Zn-ribbon topoisomerase 1
MMTEPEAREGERCPKCGTPMELAEVDPHQEEAGVDDILLRCANGHEMRVTRHQDEAVPDDPA